MGFFDSLGKLAKAGMNQLESFNMEVSQKKAEFSSKSDEELKRIFQSSWSSSAEKAAAASVLKSRGYGR